MANKGVQVVLQEEINNDDDWAKMLEKPGIYIIDIYTEWYGPCLVMVRFLKKIKLDLGSPILHLAIAKSDYITVLRRFRQKSQPIWMILVDGKMVNILIGVNSLKLIKLIENEVEMYDKFKKGEIQRRFIPWNEITEEERKNMIENEQYQNKKSKIERKIRDERMIRIRERSLKQFTTNVKTETCILFFPHTVKSVMVEVLPKSEEELEGEDELLEPVMEEKRVCEVANLCAIIYKEHELFVTESKEVQLTKEMLEEVFFVDRKILESFPPNLVDQFLNEKIYLEMLSSPTAQQDDDEDDNSKSIEQKMSILIYGNGDPLKPSPDSFAAKHMIVNAAGEKIPSLYTPTNPLSKVSVLAVLFEKFCALNGYTAPKMPPPQYLVIFEINKSDTVLPIIEELEDKIIHYGFFRSADPENPRLLCKDPDLLMEYGVEKIEKGAKLVISVLRDERDMNLLKFVDAGPIYVSPDYEMGIDDAFKFFPHDYDDMEGEVKELLEQHLNQDEEAMVEGEELLLEEGVEEITEELDGSQL